MPELLADQPPLPPELAHLWRWFLELDSAGQLTYQEMESWSRLTRRNITSTEALVLHRLDTLYTEVINGRRNRQSHHQGPKRPGRHR